MSLIAFLLVSISVFFHAGWNFLSKRKVPSLAFYTIASMSAMVMWLPGFIWSGFDWSLLPGRFWLLWGGSVGCEVLYFTGLAHAYRRGDISLVYPLARALPVLLTAATTMMFGLGRTPGPVALGGMAVLSAGCLLMPLMRWSEFSLAGYRGGALKFILLAAVGTTGYTILDSMAIRIVRDVYPGHGIFGSVFYLFLLELGIGISMFCLVLSSETERAEYRRLFLKSKTPVISGIFSSAAYILILLAMAHVTNVSYVQAFRQMSLPLGVLAGIFFLHEKPGKPRLAGIVLVVLGLMIVSLGA